MYSSLLQRIKASDRAQKRVNEWPAHKRERFILQHERWYEKLISKYRLECQCTHCMCLMDSYRKQEEGCVSCGSPEIVSPYFC